MPRLKLPAALSPRQWFTLGILAIALVLFTLLSAPANPRSDGSTYSRAPEGYGAWYAYVEQSGQEIDRLRKPLTTLFDPNPETSPSKPSSKSNSKSNSKPSNSKLKTPPTTLIHIAPTPSTPWIDRRWIAEGNRAILIGTEKSIARVTDAEFYSEHPVEIGTLKAATIKVATTRRHRKLALKPPQSLQQGQTPLDDLDENPEENLVDSGYPNHQALVTDRHGSLIWRTVIGKGEIIYILPTFFAANAYQGEAQNFAYLQALTKGDRIIMDEHVHGYRDSETAEKEGKGDLVTFFAKTPIALLLLQAMILLSVLIYGKNWRFGAVRALVPPSVNNSRAYIQALSGILQKANSTDFVTDTLCAAELKQIQRTLGLGTTTLSADTILHTWTQQTGRPAREFQDVFLSSHRHKKLSEAELIQWITKLQTLSHPT